FSTLQQIADIPYIGPERFTEIIAALTGYPLYIEPESEEIAYLFREFSLLRERLKKTFPGLSRQYHIRLMPAVIDAFEGSSVIISARVTDALTGKPKSGTPLTLVSTYGTLESYEGYNTSTGNPVTAITSLSGIAKYVLFSPLRGQLKGRQAAILESGLGRLNSNAPTPKHDIQGFTTLVQNYQAPRNENLRKAIDVYFFDQQHKITGPKDRLSAWQYREVLLLGYLGDANAIYQRGTPVEDIGMLTLRLKDWVAPWFQVYKDIMVMANPIHSQIEQIKNIGGNGETISRRIVNSTQDYLSRQRGSVGGLISHDVVDTSLVKFLGTGLESFDNATKRKIFGNIGSARIANRITFNTRILKPVFRSSSITTPIINK
ncbi:MAG: hypothetical protein J7K84_12050, partial [Deltaproteobacteria bacterium]|nr:hypothetical protein [Deltaproteobacteria bacterium]